MNIDENRRGKETAESKKKNSLVESPNLKIHKNCMQLRIAERKVEEKMGRGKRKMTLFDDIKTEGAIDRGKATAESKKNTLFGGP